MYERKMLEKAWEHKIQELVSDLIVFGYRKLRRKTLFHDEHYNVRNLQ